jgi:hypothetical protein
MDFPDLTNPQWFSELIDSLELTSEFFTASAIALIILGIVSCFFGYPIFRVLLGIVAGLAGGASSFSVAYTAFGNDLPAAIIVAVTAGVLCIIIFVKLYYIGVFLVGAGLGSFLVVTITNLVGAAQIPLLITIAGLVGGLVGLVLQKLLIIVATSLFGAVYCVMGIAQLAGFGIDPETLREDPGSIINLREPDARLIVMGSCIIVLAVIGILVQYKIDSVTKRRKEAGEPGRVREPQRREIDLDEEEDEE